jgi:hypothetical protein
LALAVGVIVLATVIIAAATSMPARDDSRFRLLDAAAVAALIVVVVALLGGATDESTLASSQGSGLVLLLLPGLIAFAAAVVASRLFGPLVRLAGRLLDRRLGARLAAVTLGRGPGAAAVTVAFLTLAFALALLAEGYRATLVRAESDQAAFVVPLDFVVREDLRSLVPVLDAASLERYSALASGSGAAPVLRLQSSSGGAAGVGGVTILGLPPRIISQLRGWREDYSDLSRSDIARSLTPAQPAALRGIPLGSRIALAASPALVSLQARIVGSDGRFGVVNLGSLEGRESTRLVTSLPERLRGGKLVALELVPPRLQDRGADAGNALSGRLRLTGLPIGTWLGTGGIVVHPVAGGAELRYRITRQSDALVRARQPTDKAPPAVVATPRLAAIAGGVGGTLALSVGGGQVPVRIAAVSDRFPGTEGEAIVGDVDALETAVDTQVPGAGRTNEIWLSVPPGEVERTAAVLARAPFSGVEVVSRAALVAEARNDPLGHGTLLALAAAALVALLLAALGLALMVISDLRDDRGDLYDLEAQGVPPTELRRVVRVRAFLVAVAGAVAGVVAGAFLALLVTRVVSVTARAAAPDPPLRTAFDFEVVVIATIVFFVLSALLVGLSTRRGFSGGRGPARAQETGT